MIENPFESGHIKNYILFYVSIVIIMILFFIASTLFNEVEPQAKKEFNTTIPEQTAQQSVAKEQEKNEAKSKFKLLDNPY